MQLSLVYSDATDKINKSNSRSDCNECECLSLCKKLPGYFSCQGQLTNSLQKPIMQLYKKKRGKLTLLLRPRNSCCSQAKS